MADVPDYIVLKRHRDLEGLRQHSWPRHLILALIAAFSILALAGVFGQRPSTTTASAAPAKLELYAPSHLRGGLLFSARFRIDAVQEVKDATLVLDSGWVEGMAINTIEPSPLGEGSTDGKLTLELGHIPAGKAYVLWMQFQVNPTNLAWHRPAGVTLRDGSRTLLHVDRSVTIYP
ncbi:MAG TPA: hypothetical protein VHC45_03285 [Gaiellaceae bacterium]|nr:hypothetical protein [Gaiellaceae bacterium]